MREYILVEYPAAVADVEKAVRMLHIDETSGGIELRLGEEEWHPSIRGDSRKTLCLLACRNSENREAHIVGKITRLVRFQSMFDFATAAPTPSALETQTQRLVSNLDLGGLEQLAETLTSGQGQYMREQDAGLAFAPPPRFSSGDFPFFKSVESNVNTASGPGGEVSSGGLAGNAMAGRRKGKAASWMHLFSEHQPHFLEEAPKELVLRCKRLHRAHFENLTRLFHDRPVWLKSALQPYTKDIGPTEIRTVLPAVAYFFTDGPWRCCWVRYGYDPRHEPEARWYQVVEIRSSRIQAMISAFPATLRRKAASVPEPYPIITIIKWILAHPSIS